MTDALDALAERTGEPVDHLREWCERGLIRATADDPVADAERVRLVRFLLGRGFDLEAIAEADAREDGLLDRFLTFLYPWGELPRYSLREVADEAGLDPALAERILTAVGFSEDEDAASDDDLQVLTILSAALAAGLPEPALLQLGRVYVDSLRRVAEAEVRLFHFYVHQRLRAQGLSGPELTEASDSIGAPMQAGIEPTILLFHRRGWANAVRDDLALHVAEAVEDSAVHDVPGTLLAAIVFVDLARFTPLTEAMGDAAAAEVLARFSDIVRAACGARHGRVVKQIGDEFMLVFFERRAAVACALDIDERSSNEPAFPAVRTGAHWGELLYREGDYIGATVNVAARLAAEARAHELLVTSSLADDARDLGAEVVPIGERSLKGISEDLELCSVRRAAPEHGERLVDPVCGMGLYPDDVAARLDSAGVSHVFCSEECLRRFVAAPDRFGG